MKINRKMNFLIVVFQISRSHMPAWNEKMVVVLNGSEIHQSFLIDDGFRYGSILRGLLYPHAGVCGH